MYLSGKNLQLRKSGRRSHPWRIIFLLALILGGLFLLSGWQRGQVQPLFIPTPTATRTPRSYAEEAEAQFSAGDLKRAIAAYEKATEIDTQNVDYWVALARIQIYARWYEEALQTAQNALLVSPNNAKAKAIYAWALDWNVAEGCHCKTLGEAEAAAVQAIALDGNYAPAHAYYSEILNDAGKWAQGSQEAQLALGLDPTSLDAHRAMGYANESVGNYEAAIEHYKDALAINPNLVTLYLRLGLNYRVQQKYDDAIAAFSKANAIDPFDIEPLLALSRTKYQTDEFGTAVQYLQQALTLEPDNPDIYGRLGLIYHKQKNYEDALPALEVAIFGKANPSPASPALTPTPGPAPTPWTISQPGLSLTRASMEYYYTLATLYASLSTPDNNMCPKSMALINQLLAQFPDDITVQSVAADSEATCKNLEAGILAPPTPALTPTPKK